MPPLFENLTVAKGGVRVTKRGVRVAKRGAHGSVPFSKRKDSPDLRVLAGM